MAHSELIRARNLREMRLRRDRMTQEERDAEDERAEAFWELMVRLSRKPN